MEMEEKIGRQEIGRTGGEERGKEKRVGRERKKGNWTLKKATRKGGCKNGVGEEKRGRGRAKGVEEKRKSRREAEQGQKQRREQGKMEKSEKRIQMER